MKRIILGSGAQGRVTLEVWRAQHPGDEFVFLDDDTTKHGKSILGAPVAGPFAMARELEGEAVIALGNNETRLSVSREHAGHVRWGNAVHPSAVLSPSATLGPGTVVFAGAIVNTGAQLAAHVIVNTGAVVEHDSLVGPAASLSPGMKSGGRVVIEEGVFVSTGVTLAARAKIGAWSVIGAGALVIGELPSRVLAYGVPARVVKPIDETFDWRRLL
jgi:UDP-perosamine 4-acetyltransferase